MQPPEKLTIDTPEQIALEFPLAGAGSRFLALTFDTFIQIGGFLVLAGLGLGALWLRAAGFTSLSTWIAAALLFGGFALYYGYFAVFEAIWGGQTPGKRAVGLRVIALSGQPITTYDALLRNLLRIVDQLPGIYAVGVLSIFLTERNQRLGDLVAGTVVVQEHATRHATTAPAEAPAARLGAARLSSEELEVIETFLNRRHSLPDDIRMRAAGQLAARIRGRLEITSAAHADDEALIAAIAAEYRRR